MNFISWKDYVNEGDGEAIVVHPSKRLMAPLTEAQRRRRRDRVWLYLHDVAGFSFPDISEMNQDFASVRNAPWQHIKKRVDKARESAEDDADAADED